MADKKNKNLVAQSLMDSINNLKTASEEVVTSKPKENNVEIVKSATVVPEVKLDDKIVEPEPKVEITIKEETTEPTKTVVVNSPVQSVEPQQQNLVITYHNPLQNLQQEYVSISKKNAEEESEVMAGLKKRPPQSEIYCNATIQVRRDFYGAINNYILDARLGKTKVLNEIFQLGMESFINKYTKKSS